jgi:hypothetical protein
MAGNVEISGGFQRVHERGGRALGPQPADAQRIGVAIVGTVRTFEDKARAGKIRAEDQGVGGVEGEGCSTG